MDLIFASWTFLAFLAVGSITPGPNNTMLAASGMNYGYQRTIPHMLGVSIGFSALLIFCMLGAGAVFAAYPVLKTVMKVIASAFLLYMAYKIATAGRVTIDEHSEAKPLTFIQGAAFQFINPKSWAVGLAAVTTMLPEGASVVEKAMIIFICVSLTSAVSMNVWTLSGKAMARLFTKEKNRRIVNACLAFLLLATIPMIVL